MKLTDIPLEEVSIDELYCSGERTTYEIPIYQRNYAWGKDEISALVQDSYDAYKKSAKGPYYIGTLVSFDKGDQVFEVIDGQQRLTTVYLLLRAMDIHPTNLLTYRARKKADDTIKSIPKFDINDKDAGIESGFEYAQKAIEEIVPENELSSFVTYFKDMVHLIRYMVPKDIDLNHYFEIMNSRGEQLEQHEVVKALLIEALEDDSADQRKFALLWDRCSEMSVYIQRQYESNKSNKATKIFGNSLCDFICSDFSNLPETGELPEDDSESKPPRSIREILAQEKAYEFEEQDEPLDTFQPIIDFPNFLLIVLKLTRIGEDGFEVSDFILDDKELIHEFDKVKLTKEFVKEFAMTLLKARYLLDNYIVHHSNEEDVLEDNPWKLQRWQKNSNEGKRKGSYANLSSSNGEDGREVQMRLVHLLSMFEVSFTARQRKNYLFYCLLYLLKGDKAPAAYCAFLEKLADKYFFGIYMNKSCLNERNTPLPGSFDDALLSAGSINTDYSYPLDSLKDDFAEIYGDGSDRCRGIPLFVFNFLDYKIWKLYSSSLRGEKTKEGSPERRLFFDRLGCGDFGLKIFDDFYFSRTRRSLEHYYPQANADGMDNHLNEAQINCLGNYAMIGSAINSSGSNYSPKTKLDHYLDGFKVKQVSVASLKFLVMMQKCKDNQENRTPGQEWIFEDIEEHQAKMIDIIALDAKAEKPN